MTRVIRQARTSDAPQYLELLKASLGEDYPDRQIYELAWCADQFKPDSDLETWVAESEGRLMASVSLLPPSLHNANPIAN